MNAPSMPEKMLRKSRRRFLLLAALFFVPLAVSFILYYGELWRPDGGTNMGELIHPARPLPAIALTLSDGSQSSAEVLRGKWSMVYVGDGRCDERCRSALSDMRQTRLLLSDKMDRVQRVFLTTGACCDFEYLNNQQQGLIVARFDKPELVALFPLYDSMPVATAGRIYLVDPLGNLMMSYASTAPSNGLIADLKKLLKLSHIG